MATAAADPLLDLDQIAAELGVSRTTAWRLVRDGAIAAVNVGRGRGRGSSGPRLRARRSAVDDYLRRSEVVPIRSGRRRAA